jgi:hypothetical protein
MPSPFPGMDPYLELQVWQDFHTRMITVLSERLISEIQPRYFILVEHRIYVEGVDGDVDSVRVADVALLSGDTFRTPALTTSTGGVAAAVECLLPMPTPRKEARLTIYDHETEDIVTVIELLSPSNKRRHGDGRREYLVKRQEFFEESFNLVELDLLRGGARLPIVGSLPPGDFYAIVSRANRRPRCEVYAWTLRDKLPLIPIPLKRGDADAVVPLQEVFDTVYLRARYDLSVKYDAPLDPPFSEVELQWAQQLTGREKTA